VLSDRRGVAGSWHGKDPLFALTSCVHRLALHCSAPTIGDGYRESEDVILGQDSTRRYTKIKNRYMVACHK
jgi:hypothetical protein